MSDEIFARDPLLLQTESQKGYGRIILHNLLIARPIVSGIPDLVELHKFPAETLQTRPIYDPPVPDTDLRERYRENRKFRRPLDKDDIAKLRLVTMAADGDKTERRVRDRVDETTKKTKKKFTKDQEAIKKAKGKLAKRLRIAAIGFRVKVSKMVGKAYFDEDLWMLRELPNTNTAIQGLPDSDGFRQLGRTTLAETSAKDRWAATVCSHLGKAVASGSHIIAMPELALPPVSAGFDIERDLRACSKPASAGHVHNHFVFSGSRHEGGSNRGMLFHLEDQNLQGHTHWHYKVASARSLGENVLGPYSDEFPSYIAKVALDGAAKKITVHITVAICYDSFDPSTFLSLVLHSAARSEYFPHHVILVPSFNPSTQFVEFLRDLSFLTHCTVIYVNGLHGDAKMFVAGFAISDLHDETSPELLARLEKRITKDEERRDKKFDDAQHKLKDGDLDGHQKAYAKGRMYKQRAEAMGALLTKLEVIEKDGGLKHLITVENCDACEDGSHADDYGCASDILYYNIDARLLAALTTFRRHYFAADETFLPEPYRVGSLEKAKADLDQRLAIRRRQQAQYMRPPTEEELKSYALADGQPSGEPSPNI